MREGRKKEASKVKKTTRQSKTAHVHVYMLMRDEEGRKKEASKVKQTTKQSNTAHPRQSLFLRKMSCLGWDMYMYMYMYMNTRKVYTYTCTCTCTFYMYICVLADYATSALPTTGSRHGHPVYHVGYSSTNSSRT